MNISFGFPSRGRARVALAGGFGGLLALLVFLGVFAARSLDRVRASGMETSRSYLMRQDLLDDLRSAAYLVSSNVRNYLIDPNAGAVSGHRDLARQEWRRVQEHLRDYRLVAAPERRALVLQLQTELDAYWLLASEGLSLNGNARIESAYQLLRDRLGPQREQFLAALDAVQSKDLADLRTSIDSSVNSLDALSGRLWTVIAFCAVMGALLAVVSSHYIARFEREAAQRYAESQDAAVRLEQLSHRLLAVQEEERRSLARELHDEVGQWLGALLMDLGQLRQALRGFAPSPETEAAGERLHSAVDLGERTLRSVRDIGLLLRPSMLDDLGLIPALHWHARETSRRTGVRVQVDTEDEDIELSDEVRTAVYRVVQEALVNAVRHAEARHVSIALLCRGGRLRVMVKDDGKGFDPGITRGLGILGMQERIVRLGGEYRIHSAPGQGTVVTFDLAPATPPGDPSSHHDEDIDSVGR
jgi:signal transduction histidine kinase